MSGQGNPRKRQKVTDDGSVAASAGRPNIVLDDNTKKKAHDFCRKFYTLLIHGLNDETIRDVRFQIKVSKAMFSYYTIFRVAHNANTSERYTKFLSGGDYKFNLANATVIWKKDDIKQFFAEKAKFNEPGWAGQVTPVIALWALFGHRLDDCRMMPTDVFVSRNGNNDNVMPLEYFGVPTYARHFAYGIGYPPALRSTLSQSMGIVTILYMYVKSDAMYKEKWKNAAMRAMSHIPNCSDIIEIMGGLKVKEVKGIISLLCNLFVFVGARNQHRWAFPPMYLNAQELDKINFSSVAGLYEYCNAQVKLRCADAVLTKVEFLTFLMITGSMYEDVGIIKFMTGINTVYTRSEMTGVFINFLSETNGYQHVTDKDYIINLKNYSGAAGSAMVDMFGSTSGPMNAEMVFRGRRNRKVSPAMMALLNPNAPHVGSVSNVNECMLFLQKLLRRVEGHIPSNSVFEAGTTGWVRFYMGNEFAVTETPTEEGTTYFNNPQM